MPKTQRKQRNYESFYDNLHERHDIGLVRAIEYAGGYTELARLLKHQISWQGISHWRRVPDYWIIPLEEATGIPRERLRPDLYR